MLCSSNTSQGCFEANINWWLWKKNKKDNSFPTRNSDVSGLDNSLSLGAYGSPISPIIPRLSRSPHPAPPLPPPFLTMLLCLSIYSLPSLMLLFSLGLHWFSKLQVLLWTDEHQHITHAQIVFLIQTSLPYHVQNFSPMHLTSACSKLNNHHSPQLISSKVLFLVKGIAIYQVANKDIWESPSDCPLSSPFSPLKGLPSKEDLRWVISQRFISLLGYSQRWLLCMSSFHHPSRRDMPFLRQGEKKTRLKFAMDLAWCFCLILV